MARTICTMGDPGDAESSLDLLAERVAAASLKDDVANLVLAAALGEEELALALGGGYTASPASETADPAHAPEMFLVDVDIEGLRGIGESARLGLKPGPGVTLVVGRNGSGKSSFAEGAELALTGTSSRWARRTKAWAEGWANLHAAGERAVTVRLAVAGQDGPTVITRSWPAGAALDKDESYAQRPGQPRQEVSGLGLDAALSTWRPFLSYNELGGLLEEGPSKLYDALSRVLGLEEWSDAEERLKAARRITEEDAKAAKSKAGELRAVLDKLADPRAAQARACLSAKGSWNLEKLEALAVGGSSGGPDTGLAVLASLDDPDPAAVGAAAGGIRRALVEVEQHVGTDAERAMATAQLLEQALVVAGHRGDETCPVCGTPGVLGAEWASSAHGEVRRLRSEAATAVAAASGLETAVRSARGLISPAPRVLAATPAELDCRAVSDAWTAWSDYPGEPEKLADHLEGSSAVLVAALSDLRDEAATVLRARTDEWRPVAEQLAAFVPVARKGLAAEPRVELLKTAATWLARETTAVRNERFAPIGARVQDIWDALRQSSNVSLDGVALAGTATQRRVELSVSVDESAGAALAVMSQGELHSLALSLFIPRATLPESPFRFVVIDDPVQAMDAARVDGLAQVLAEVGRERQVVVFTHDERLPAAVRRLDLPATVLEVSRSARSKVSIRTRRNPADDCLDDARAILATTDFPAEARRRVVPGLCRNALEAVCKEQVRVRMIGAGRPHSDVESILADAGKTLQLLALAYWSDAGRAGDVLAETNRRFGALAADCVQAIRAGSHDLIDNDPRTVIEQTERLVIGVRELK